MKEFKIDNKNVRFVNNDEATETVAKKYLAYAEEHKDSPEHTIASITITLDGEDADITTEYVQDKPKIERIRRITGYLVGTVANFNDAKKAEVAERVTHV